MSQLSISELWPLFALFSVFAVLLLALWRVQSTSPAGRSEAAPPEQVPESTTRASAAGGARRRRGGLARMRAAVNDAGAGRSGTSGAGGDGDGDGEDGADEGAAAPARVKGRVKKDANRQARREAREAREEALAARKEKMEKEEEERQAVREAEKEAEAIAEEEARMVAEEKAKKEEEEYAEWKGLIEVEEAGDEGEDPFVDDSALLERFVGYVRSNKIVVLEELAAEFGLKTEEAIERLTALEENGTLTGVFDDRGKFIYVSPEEMQAVADFIVRRGRVSITELAAESTKLLHLDTAADVL